MSRQDNRSLGTFKRDIKYGTDIETYFANSWEKLCSKRSDIVLKNLRSNGVDNSGKYLEKSYKMSEPDYIGDLKYLDSDLTDLKIEIKFVPTPGKFTLKVSNLKDYIRYNSSILFIYPHAFVEKLTKPRNYNYHEHIFKIEKQIKSGNFRWGLMFPDQVKKLYEDRKDSAEKIRYMGNKLCVVLKQEDFGKYLKEEIWE